LLPCSAIDDDLSLLIGIQVAPIASESLLIERQIEAKADVVAETGANVLFKFQFEQVSQILGRVMQVGGHFDVARVENAQLVLGFHQRRELHAVGDILQLLLLEADLGVTLGDVQIISRVVQLDDSVGVGLLIDDPELANLFKAIASREHAIVHVVLRSRLHIVANGRCVIVDRVVVSKKVVSFADSVGILVMEAVHEVADLVSSVTAAE